jgi:signal transduction histidine kinase
MAEPVQAIDAPSPRSGRLRAVGTRWIDSPDGLREARGRRVARDLVELSRLQRGGEQAECGPLDLAAFLPTICADYPHLRLDGPPRALLTTDSRRLARILFALLDNAYLHGAPPVTVSYDEDEICVEDAGGGFAARVLERAPEPFLTGERAQGRGVGRGLAIAARQATLIDAELLLGNSSGGGALARVSFTAPPTLPAAA